MRIAIAGKGGSGKTTIAGTMARLLAQSGRSVLAIDADTNPNLATILGMTPDAIQQITDLPRNLMERREQPDGSTKSVFAADPQEVIREYGATGPDGVRMLVMGRIGHGGAG